VDELEERYPGFNGLNLTWELREGLIKHSSPYDAPVDKMSGFMPGVVPSIEAQIINFADEIAYNNHDIDDGLKSGYINLEMLDSIGLWRQASLSVRSRYPSIDDKRLVYQTISTLIGMQIGDLYATTIANIERLKIRSVEDLRLINQPVVYFSDDITMQNMELKEFLFTRLYRHHRVEKMRVKSELFITRLFEAYLDHPSLLPPKYQARFDVSGVQRVICDYIAGMTDRFALDEYRRLFEPYER
jgi:dGTPase